MNLKKGLFVAFEGIDGCGKTTQIYKLLEYLFALDKHNHIILTRNPYKDANIRSVIKEEEDVLKNAEKIANLFIEDRKKQAKEVIIPNLEKGHIIISDRYKLATLTYQTAQGLDMQDLIDKQKDLPVPDITFVIDVPIEVAEERMKKEQGRDLHRFEKNREFAGKIRDNFEKARESLAGENIIIINGDQKPEKVFEEIKTNFEKAVIGEKKKKYKFIDELPLHLKSMLAKYFTNVGGNTFAIKNLPTELAGGAMARYSRAPTGIQLTIINEFLDEHGNPSQEKGSELMNRVLNAFGDESVGELEGTHVGIENISIYLTNIIEDRRIGGSPIEQSTRYVKYDQKEKNGKWRYLRPKEIINAGMLEKYEKVNDKAFEIYSKLIEKLEEYFKKQFPENQFEIEVNRNGELTKVKKDELEGEAEEKAFNTAYKFTVRCAALDVGRCVLPASTLTNMGVFGNGRFFTKLITTLKSCELEEEKERGFEIERELQKVIPTFIKWNKDDPDLIRGRNKRMRDIAKNIFSDIKPKDDMVTLVSRAEHFDEILTGSLFPHTNISAQQILEKIKKMSHEQKMEILQHYVGKRETRRDRTPRGLEAGYAITFDLVGTFAEYRDLERHRMNTQQKQLMTTELGFIMPAEIREIGMEKEVEKLVKEMEILNKEIRDRGLLAASQYATLFNHRIRFLIGMNLREFQHLSELRTIPQGHFGYRAMTMEMARQLDKRDEWSKTTHEFVDYSDPGNKISRAKEQSRIAGENLAKGVDGSVDLD
jgi:dTMP kinase